MMARTSIHDYLDKRRIATTEQLRKEARFLNRIRVKAPSRRIEPLDGEEFDDLSDDDRKRLRESF